MKLRIVIMMFVMAGWFCTAAYAASPQPVVIAYDGRVLELKQAPYNDQGTVMVPLRGLFEQLGIQVSWDQQARTVTARFR